MNIMILSKALGGFKPLRSFVTPSLVTTMSSENGTELSRRGTWLCAVLVNRFSERVYISILSRSFYDHRPQVWWVAKFRIVTDRCNCTYG